MSSKPAIIRQRDVTRILKGGLAAGVALGVLVKDGEARFVPVDELVAAKEPSSLAKWRRARDAGEIDGAA
jgi:hypothetical protein